MDDGMKAIDVLGGDTFSDRSCSDMSKRGRKSGPGGIEAIYAQARDRSIEAKKFYDKASEVTITYTDGSTETFKNAFEMRRAKAKRKS